MITPWSSVSPFFVKGIGMCVKADEGFTIANERDELVEEVRKLKGNPSDVNYVHMAVAEKVEQERDRLREELRRLKGERLAQRQDALDDQLRDVIGLAEQAGCYDAADFIKSRLERESPEPEDVRTHGEG